MSTKAITKEIKFSANSEKKFVAVMESKTSSINLGKKVNIKVK